MENLLLVLSFLIGLGIGYLWGNASGKGYVGKTSTSQLRVKTASARKKRR